MTLALGITTRNIATETVMTLALGITTRNIATETVMP